MDPELTAVEEVVETGMSKDAKIMIVGIIALSVIGASAYFIYKSKNKPPTTPADVIGDLIDKASE